MKLTATIWEHCRELIMELCFRFPNCPLPEPKSSPAEILYEVVKEGVLLPPFGRTHLDETPGKIQYIETLKQQNSAMRSPEQGRLDVFEYGSYSHYVAAWVCWTADKQHKFKKELLEPFLKARGKYTTLLKAEADSMRVVEGGFTKSRQGRQKVIFEMTS